MKLTDVSCVKDSRLLRLPVVVEQGCVGVNIENFHGTFSCCLVRQPACDIYRYRTAQRHHHANSQPLLSPYALAQH